MALSNFTSAPAFTFGKYRVQALLRGNVFQAFTSLHNVRAHRVQTGAGWVASAHHNLSVHRSVVRQVFGVGLVHWYAQIVSHKVRNFSLVALFTPCPCGCSGNASQVTAGCWSA